MAIVKMKRLRLVGMTADREALLARLQHFGCVEISEPEECPEDPAWAALTRADTAALAGLQGQKAALNAALDTLNKYDKAKSGGLLTPLPLIPEGKLFDEQTARSALAAAETISQAERRMEAIRSEQSRLHSQRQSLEPWAALDVPLDIRDTRAVTFVFGAVPTRVDLDALRAELAEATELCVLESAGRDGDQQYLLVICHKSAQEDAFEVLKRAGFARSPLRDWAGAAAENVAAIDARLAELDQALTAAQGDITAQAGHRDELKLCIDRMEQDIARAQSTGRLMESRSAFLLEGWFPADEEEKLAKLLQNYSAAWEFSDPTPEEYPQVPIKLKNNPLSRPFTVITEMYSMPAYDGVDPNPLMAPFFILFFGFMMNDIGYGLLMVLGTALYLKLARPRGNTRNMMSMFLMCGISSIFWGCLTGSFFGDFLPKLFDLTGIDHNFVWFWPPLFTPVNDIITVMIGSIALGVIQVFAGMAISTVHKCKTGDVLGALFEEVAWWCILIGAALAIVGSALEGMPAALGTAGLAVLVLGAVLLLAGNIRTKKGFGILTGFFGAIYNGISGYFSDILSYLRLMALMMAGSIIASVFNTLGSVFGLVPFLIVALIGNALNLVLNLLGCYVHTMRLQCLEFFGRFYKDGGKPFRPLTVETKYVDILKEEI